VLGGSRSAIGVDGSAAVCESRAVGDDAVVDSSVIATEERTDLRQAEVVPRIVAKGPPDLVSGASNGPRTASTA
jgi:hypothetical protein